MKQNKNANSSVFEASVGSVSPTELASAVNTKLDEKINNGTIASGSQVASLSSQLEDNTQQLTEHLNNHPMGVDIDDVNIGTDKVYSNSKTKALIDEVANKGTTTEVLERVTKEEIDRQVADGTIANLTIADGSITNYKYKDKSISIQKCDFIQDANEIINIFDGNYIKNGAFINDDGSNNANAIGLNWLSTEVNKAVIAEIDLQIGCEYNIYIRGSIGDRWRVVGYDVKPDIPQIYGVIPCTQILRATKDVYEEIRFVNRTLSVLYVQVSATNQNIDLVIEKISKSDGVTFNFPIFADGLKYGLNGDEILDNSISKEKLKFEISNIDSHNSTEFYKAFPQPSADGVKLPHCKNATLDELNNLFSDLQLKFPSYITKTNLGKDQSNTYDIFRYDFKPNNAEYKIILGGGIHWEHTLHVTTLYNFLNDICEKWEQDEILKILRFKVHIIVLPIQNPYGFAKKIRHNCNGVDLNRNFDYKWEEYVGDGYFYKGSSAFSEKETQYIRDILVNNKDSLFYLCTHMEVYNNQKFRYFFATAKNESETYKSLDNSIGYMECVYPKEAIENNKYVVDAPHSFCYSENVCGIPAFDIEYQSDDLNPSISELHTTRSLEWFGNALWFLFKRLTR